MIDREKVIKGLELCLYAPDPGQPRKYDVSCDICPYWEDKIGCNMNELLNDALVLLKAQDDKLSECVPAPEKLPNETKAMLDDMTAEERLRMISEICVDWDGYRTAKELGTLINEIWSYAAYPVKA